MTKYPQESVKPYNEDEKKSVQVERMFDNIAPAYDQLNHTLSWGIDKSWRKKAINWLKPFQPQRMMDVATGTGDFAIQACRVLNPKELIGTDISEGMMNVGRQKVKDAGLEGRISFAKEDCTALTFPDKRFDAITVAFGVRNFEDLDKGLKENASGIGRQRQVGYPRTIRTGMVSNEATLCPLFQSGHTNIRQTFVQGPQCLYLFATIHQSFPPRRNHAGNHFESRIQQGRFQTVDFRHLYPLHSN